MNSQPQAPSTSNTNKAATWTPEETYKLLDLIAKYGENWNEIQN